MHRFTTSGPLGLFSALVTALGLAAAGVMSLPSEAFAAASACEDTAALQRRLDDFDSRWNASDAWGLTAQFAMEGSLGAAAGRQAVYRELIERLGRVREPRGRHDARREAFFLGGLQDRLQFVACDARLLAAHHVFVDGENSVFRLHAGDHRRHGGCRIGGLLIHRVGLHQREVRKALERERVFFAWLPALAWRLDKHWRRLRAEVPRLRRAPSEYIREHIWVTTQPMEEPERPEDMLATIEWIGLERVMFSTDYPHWDQDDPRYAFKVQLPEDWARLIYRDNARALYRLD